MTANCHEGYHQVVRDPAKRDDVKEILAEIGNAKPCETYDLGAKTSIFGGLIQAGAGGSKSIGCEQVSVMVDAFYSSRKNIACTLRKKSQRADVNFFAGQKINFTNGVTGRFDCEDMFRLRNVIKGDIVITQKLGSDDVKEIKNEIKETVKTTIDAMQKSEKEFASTPQGQRSYQAAIKNIDEYMESTTVDNQIQEIVARADANQEINLVNNGLLTGKNCIIENETIISLVANNILQSVAKEAFSNQAVVEYLNELRNKQENKASGLFQTSTIGMIIGLIVLLVIAYFGYRYAKSKGLI